MMRGNVEATSDLSLVRSLLFTPADRPERFAKAAASAADCVILDLEDGVGLAAKAAARKAVMAFFSEAPIDRVWALRLNHISTEAGLQDLLALRQANSKPAAVMLPKTEATCEVDIALSHLATGGKSPAIIALIESGRGLAAAETIAAHPAVVALAFGGVDLAADLRAEFAWEPMLFARSRIIQAAATSAIAALDVPFLDIHDDANLAKEAAAAKALGFTGKLAIHPNQINPINQAFSPSREQLARAERIVAASNDAGGGVCVVDGKMVDRPVVLAALRTIKLASRA